MTVGYILTQLSWDALDVHTETLVASRQMGHEKGLKRELAKETGKERSGEEQRRQREAQGAPLKLSYILTQLSWDLVCSMRVRELKVHRDRRRRS